MDKDFFVQEIDAHLGVLYRVAFTLLRNDEDCKDAISEATLKAWEKRHTLRDESRFKAWMIRILSNTCYNILRKRKRMVYLDEIPEPSISPPDPSLDMALSSLPEKYRLPIMLFYAEGMQYNEIAEAMHLPLTTIRGRIYMAKDMLRKELQCD